MKRKVGFAAIFTDIIRRRDLSKEASIHTKLTAIEVVLKEINKRKTKNG